MQETDEYKDDVLGLRSLEEGGRLLFLSYVGEHIAVPTDMWRHQILPLLGEAKPIEELPTKEIYHNIHV